MSAYDGMRREGIVRAISSRVAPQEDFHTLVPAKAIDWDRSFIYALCPKTDKQRRRTMTMKIPYKIYLEESEMPKQYYNLRADMKQKPAPLLNPQTK